MNAFAKICVASAALLVSSTAGRAELWTPAMSDSELWLDAASIGQADGTAVSQWDDQSGNDNHAMQTDTTKQPTLKTDQLNGHSVVQFPDGTDYFNSVTLDSNGGFAFFAVLNANATGGYHNVFDRSANSPMLWIRPDTQYEFNTGSGPVGGDAGGWDILGGIVNNSTGSTVQQLFENGTLIGSSTTAITVPSSGVYSLFNRGGGGAFQGHVGELIIYGRDINEDERLVLEGYLAHKWGVADSLPDDHPYKDAAPVPEPSTATLLALLSVCVGWAGVHRHKRHAA